MAYEKTIWRAGDTITSEKLNNIEDGVAAALVAPPQEHLTVIGS